MVTGGIVGFNPDVFVFSLDPEDTMKVPAYTRLIQRCIEKGLHLYHCGYKPVVLLGEEAVLLQAPWVKTAGGLKAWLGHYTEQPWKGATDAEYQAKKIAFLKG